MRPVDVRRICGHRVPARFVAQWRRGGTRRSRKKVEDDHNSASIAETEERMALLYKAKMYPHGSEECERIMRQYLKLKELHDKKWNERVRRIVDAEVPIDLDEEMKKEGGDDCVYRILPQIGR